MVEDFFLHSSSTHSQSQALQPAPTLSIYNHISDLQQHVWWKSIKIQLQTHLTFSFVCQKASEEMNDTLQATVDLRLFSSYTFKRRENDIWAQNC